MQVGDRREVTWTSGDLSPQLTPMPPPGCHLQCPSIYAVFPSFLPRNSETPSCFPLSTKCNQQTNSYASLGSTVGLTIASPSLICWYISSFSLSCPRTCYVDQPSFKLAVILLPLHPECWNSRQARPYPVPMYLFFMVLEIEPRAPWKYSNRTKQVFPHFANPIPSFVCLFVFLPCWPSGCWSVLHILYPCFSLENHLKGTPPGATKTKTKTKKCFRGSGSLFISSIVFPKKAKRTWVMYIHIFWLRAISPVTPHSPPTEISQLGFPARSLLTVTANVHGAYNTHSSNTSAFATSAQSLYCPTSQVL